MNKLALHWWILIAMGVGILYGVVAAQFEYTEHVHDYIKPVGSIFLNLLKMIAVPLVLFSLVAGVASLNDTAKVGRIGGKTMLLYVGTTALAITIGLVAVNLLAPGSNIPQATADKLMARFADNATEKIAHAESVEIKDQIVGIIPTNPFDSLSNAYNGKMLQVVFFALILGIALTRLSNRRSVDHVVQVFSLLSDAVIEMVHLIMKIAPLGVFALMADVVADLGKNPDELADLMTALLGYMATVVIALALHVILVYGSLLRFLAKVSPLKFLRAMAPAELLAFSSSSSGATLPVTMECVEKGVGVDEEVSSFVLPLGATVNMDGTGLYQGVAAVFIATFYGVSLDLGQQLTIILTATLASIGTAAVPGVGIVMLTIVLGQFPEVPNAGIALILGVDRPLDMCRTVVNVIGDGTVATCVARSEGLLKDPPGD